MERSNYFQEGEEGRRQHLPRRYLKDSSGNKYIQENGKAVPFSYQRVQPNIEEERQPHPTRGRFYSQSRPGKVSIREKYGNPIQYKRVQPNIEEDPFLQPHFEEDEPYQEPVNKPLGEEFYNELSFNQGIGGKKPFLKPIGMRKSPEEEWKSRQSVYDFIPNKKMVFEDNSYDNPDFDALSEELSWDNETKGTSNYLDNLKKIRRVKKNDNIYYKKPFSKAIKNPGVSNFNNFYEAAYPGKLPKAFMKSGARYYPQVPGKSLAYLLQKKKIDNPDPYLKKGEDILAAQNMIHPDPHPGNYFLSDDEIYPIDFSIIED